MSCRPAVIVNYHLVDLDAEQFLHGISDVAKLGFCRPLITLVEVWSSE